MAATHPNLKFLVQLVVNMYRGGQERVTTLSSAFNKTCWRLCHGLGRHFTRLVLEIEIDGIMNTESFDLWKASDMQLIHLTFLNDLKHTANVKKNNTIKHYQSWMASPEPEPDHY